MKGKVRFGVVGLVHDHVWPVWGEGYLRELLELPEAELVACADVNAELLERARRECGIESLYANYREMVDKEDLDAVLMALPNDEKAEATEFIAGSGLHILMDKPMAATYGQAKRIESACRQAEVKLLINWPTAFMPCIHTAHSLARSGAIGRVYELKSRVANPGPEHHGCSDYFLEWLFDPDKNGGGALVDYCCYGVVFSLWFLGMPRRVIASAGRYVKDNIISEDNAYVVMDYDDGHAMAEGSWSQFGADTVPEFFRDNMAVTITGSKGTMAFDWFGGKVRLVSEEHPEGIEIDADPLPKETSNGPALFVKAVLEDLPVTGMVSPDLCLKSQEIISAAYRSLETGAYVQIPLEKDE